jgi:hypothetical protein
MLIMATVHVSNAKVTKRRLALELLCLAATGCCCFCFIDARTSAADNEDGVVVVVVDDDDDDRDDGGGDGDGRDIFFSFGSVGRLSSSPLRPAGTDRQRDTGSRSERSDTFSDLLRANPNTTTCV